jgi:hypothetical protein
LSRPPVDAVVLDVNETLFSLAHWPGWSRRRMSRGRTSLVLMSPTSDLPMVLQRVHSGHVGDYVTWLFAGTALLAALVGLPLP